MKPDLDALGHPLRSAAPHRMAAAIAVLGAGALQAMWPAAASSGTWQWWVLLLVATAYLLATAEFHWRHAQWRASSLAPRLRGLGRGLGLDVLALLMAGVLIASGHTTSVMQAGLWLLAPVLIGVSAASGMAEGLALYDRKRRFGNHAPPSEVLDPTCRRDILRFVSFAALVVSLLVLR